MSGAIVMLAIGTNDFEAEVLHCLNRTDRERSVKLYSVLSKRKDRAPALATGAGLLGPTVLGMVGERGRSCRNPTRSAFYSPSYTTE